MSTTRENLIEKLAKVAETIEIAKALIDNDRDTLRSAVANAWPPLKETVEKDIASHTAAIAKLERYGAKLSMQIFESFPYPAQNKALAVEPKPRAAEPKRKPFLSLDRDGSLY